jgi:hypothetical protein
MGITLERAQNNLTKLRENNYVASKALIAAGYTEQSAKKQSKKIFNRSIKKVATEQLKSIVSSNNPISNLFGIVGISDKEVLAEYIKILKQDKDLSTKLKSMLPLLSQLGLKWNEEQVKVTVPTLNITMEDNKAIDSPVIKDIIDAPSS